MKRRNVVLAAAAGVAAACLPSLAAVGLPPVEVFKSPTCGCCGAWADHLKAAGFPVNVVEVEDPSTARRKHGLPEKYASCHTGIVDSYVVEGHVPATEVKKLLTLKPSAIGIAVPGMPVGSPGMEMGDNKDPYDVLLIDKRGRAIVFARYTKH